MRAAPYLSEKLAMRERTVWLRDKRAKQIPFSRRQMNRRTGSGDCSPSEIDDQVTDPDLSGLCPS